MKAFLSSHTLLPGLALSTAVAGSALALEQVQIAATGKPWLGGLVLAILIGACVRTAWALPPGTAPGIQYAAKTMLELAVILMGATISSDAIAAAGLPLLLSIIGTVAGAILAGFLIGRLLGLSAKLAMLVACGNAICGNSAIAAVAPVIDADSDDVAMSIAFTAVLGIAVIVALPIIAHILHLTPAAAGILTGLTVYAVPQVMAAAAPMGAAAIQSGMVVKLVRVLMLVPVVAALSLLRAQRRATRNGASARCSLPILMPPFILAFLGLAAANSLGMLPQALVAPAHGLSDLLAVLAMAGLGLGVDLRSVVAVGPRVVAAVVASLLVLVVIAVAMLRMLGLA